MPTKSEKSPSDEDEVAHSDPYLDWETQEALEAENSSPPSKRRRCDEPDASDQPAAQDSAQPQRAVSWDTESETEEDDQPDQQESAVRPCVPCAQEDPSTNEPPWRAGHQRSHAHNAEGQSMAKTLRCLLPSSAFEELVKQAQSKIQDTARRVLGDDARVKSFGSILQGTFLEGSDLDLYIVRDKPELVEKHPQQVNALRRLESSLPLQGFEVQEKRYEWHVRVPILILVYKSSSYELQVDISIGEADHEDVAKGEVDRMIQAALNKAPVALPMVLLVKRWAKIEGLNKAYEKTLSPLAWTLLCLFFLIRQKVLPSDALAEASQTDAPKREPEELCRHCPKKEVLADFFSMVCALGTRSRQNNQGPCGIRVLPAQECYGEVSDKSLFYVEDPAARSIKDRMVNVARMVKDKEVWERLLVRCQAANEVLSMPRFNPDIFFRKRVLMETKAIQPKPMPRPPAKPAIPPKARPAPAAPPPLRPTAKPTPKPPPKAQPQPPVKAQPALPKAPPKPQPVPPKATSVLKMRQPAPLKPGVSRPIPARPSQGVREPPSKTKRVPQTPPKTPPKKEGHPKQASWKEQRPPVIQRAVVHPWQVNPWPPPRAEKDSGSKWVSQNSQGSQGDRWKRHEGVIPAAKRERSQDERQRNDTWQNARWKQREEEKREQRWQRTTWKV